MRKKATKAFETLRPSGKKGDAAENPFGRKGFGNQESEVTVVTDKSTESGLEENHFRSLEEAIATGSVEIPRGSLLPLGEHRDSEDGIRAVQNPKNLHAVTFAGIFVFTAILYFRPYELIPGLSGFTSMALVAAAATLIVYIPTQIGALGNLTRTPVEIKCALFLAVWAFVTIPIAKDPSLAWTEFSEVFIKTVIIFVVMVNTLTTRTRIKALMWLGIGVGLMLSYQAIGQYQKGEFQTEGYRVSIDFGGMFGNPNDMSIHLVIFIPLAFVLGLAAKNWLMKALYFSASGLMVAAVVVTQSRGGFLGILALTGVIAWKLGRSHRFKTMVATGVLLIGVLAFAPGNYGIRVASIFIPSLDPVGSSNQRIEALQRSVIVTLRNPLGIGIGNSPIVGVHELGTHNAFTQVSSELGWIPIIVYLILLVYPVRRLDMMERDLYGKGEHSSLYFLSIGLQASIAAYMVSSFFASVAYLWYVYYPIAFSIGLRFIHARNEASLQSSSALVDDSAESGPDVSYA